jgi:hypothetical protein
VTDYQWHCTALHADQNFAIYNNTTLPKKRKRKKGHRHDVTETSHLFFISPSSLYREKEKKKRIAE